MNNNIIKNIQLEISGMGMVLYSDSHIFCLEKGEYFFDNEFSTPEKVERHIKDGDVIGFNLGTSGVFNITFIEGYPSINFIENNMRTLELGIKITNGKLSIIDLFWLMEEWTQECPEEQQISLKNGIYLLKIVTKKPNSGIWGDFQDIYIFIDKVKKMPVINYEGVPSLI